MERVYAVWVYINVFDKIELFSSFSMVAIFNKVKFSRKIFALDKGFFQEG